MLTVPVATTLSPAASASQPRIVAISCTSALVSRAFVGVRAQLGELGPQERMCGDVDVGGE